MDGSLIGFLRGVDTRDMPCAGFGVEKRNYGNKDVVIHVNEGEGKWY